MVFVVNKFCFLKFWRSIQLEFMWISDLKEEEGICDSSGKKILSFGWGWHHLCWTWYSTFPVDRACTGQWQGWRAVLCQQFPIWWYMVLVNLSDTRYVHLELYHPLLGFSCHSCAPNTFYGMICMWPLCMILWCLCQFLW